MSEYDTLTPNSSTSSLSSSLPKSDSPFPAVEANSPSSPRTLRERCGVTFFISFAPPNFGGPPKGHLEPRANNLPRRRKGVQFKPVAVDHDMKEFEFFSPPQPSLL
ncbi:hypothetical protein BDZ94DRAFT_1254656 [Collybia nuda]|uniref:Uncharacterized protein n=1 Tax=Collybia nuda TaxID=64659 RepID=A0A9P5YAA2_9AGAR|nr:hypothetical protein BDZ94DRAFT_1254656 [Collybia nuda]